MLEILQCAFDLPPSLRWETPALKTVQCGDFQTVVRGTPSAPRGCVTVLALGLELVLDTPLSSISLLLQQKQIQCYML